MDLKPKPSIHLSIRAWVAMLFSVVPNAGQDKAGSDDLGSALCNSVSSRRKRGKSKNLSFQRKIGV